jgi:hypothetical protein
MHYNMMRRMTVVRTQTPPTAFSRGLSLLPFGLLLGGRHGG